MCYSRSFHCVGRWLIAATLPLLLAACPHTPGVVRETMDHDGRTRTYRVYVPSGYTAKEAVPLLLALHPFTGSGESFARMTGFDGIAEESGFIVAYPDGILRRWNYRSPEDVSGPRVLRGADLGFLTSLIDQLQQDYAIDPVRIYVAGASNGAFMTMRLVCEHPELFAGAAAVMATMPLDLELLCSAGPPLPFLLIHGDEDPFVPFEGGEAHARFGESEVFLSAPDTVAVWVNRNGCELDPRVELLPETAPDDGTRVRVERFEDCMDGAAVWFYNVMGGGHTWPGQPHSFWPERLLGRVSHEIDASAVIWDFFSRQSAPN